MATKGKKAAPREAAAKKTARSAMPLKSRKAPERAPHSEAYEAALKDYTGGLELLRKGDVARALETFKRLEGSDTDEPELADRARTYALLCARRLAPATPAPKTAEQCYLVGVVRGNEGRYDEAGELLDRALKEEPDSARYLYARASIRALQGRTEAAVADLRRAVAGDGKLRFQASNDPDFEKVRDDAAFIDVIEPSSVRA
jgi:tetratricopeptide (TPR) repeat protein